MANKIQKQNDKGAKDDPREAPESGEPRNSSPGRGRDAEARTTRAAGKKEQPKSRPAK